VSTQPARRLPRPMSVPPSIAQCAVQRQQAPQYPGLSARIDELMCEFADAAKVKVEFLQERLLPILEASAQDLFDEAGNLKPVATLQRDCAAAIKSIKFDRKTGKVSLRPADVVAEAAEGEAVGRCSVCRPSDGL
jgi:hypothetical protein